MRDSKNFDTLTLFSFFECVSQSDFDEFSIRSISLSLIAFVFFVFSFLLPRSSFNLQTLNIRNSVENLYAQPFKNLSRIGHLNLRSNVISSNRLTLDRSRLMGGPIEQLKTSLSSLMHLHGLKHSDPEHFVTKELF